MWRRSIVFTKIELTDSSLHDVSKHNSAVFFVHFGFECETILQHVGSDGRPPRTDSLEPSL
jgi:hypothetical protein